MGNCLRLARADSVEDINEDDLDNRSHHRHRIHSPGHNSDSSSSALNVTKNRPLRTEKIRWKSDIPLTEGQLKSKRDEFWDTAPAFEGKQEIWNALKAAAEAVETSDDYQLAQAILDGAGVSLPNGTLVNCYDELGNRYVIPVYCLSYPINLTVSDAEDSEEESGESGAEEEKKSDEGDGGGKKDKEKISDDKKDEVEEVEKLEIEDENSEEPAKKSEPVIEKSSQPQIKPPEPQQPVYLGREQRFKVRLSLACDDVRMTMFANHTVAMAKKRLREQRLEMLEKAANDPEKAAAQTRSSSASGNRRPRVVVPPPVDGDETAKYMWAPPPSRQRWYFGGKYLSDKLKICEMGVPSNYVVQCVVIPREFETKKSRRKGGKKSKRDKNKT